MIRKPSVAGMFYPSEKESLRSMLKDLFIRGYGKQPNVNPNGKYRLLGLVSPHAGYIYSGFVAAAGYGRLAEDGKHTKFIIIGPNHTGLGPPVSLMADGKWVTPLGKTRIENEIASQLLEYDIFTEDVSAHLMEHSIEVQLPFLQYIYGAETIRIVPICMKSQDKSTALNIAKSIHKAIGDEKVVVIASSDMSHYEPLSIAKKKDGYAIDAIVKMDVDSLYNVINEYSISMCGFGPVSVLIELSKLRGYLKPEVFLYSTSAETSGDESQVVGYVSIGFYRD